MTDEQTDEIQGIDIGDSKYLFNLSSLGGACGNYISKNKAIKRVWEDRQCKYFDGEKLIGMRYF